VGLLLASELALHRLQVTVVERRTTVDEQLRAGTIHARAAQLLRRRGYLPAGPLAAPEGALAQSPFHFAALERFPIVSPAIEGPPVVTQWQAELERFLEAVCLARGVTILRGHEALAIDQDAGGVRVIVRPAGDPAPQRGSAAVGQTQAASRALHAAWLVGADGGRSLARQAAGIGAEDRLPTMRALLGTVRFADPERVPVGWHRTPRGWTLVNPGVAAGGQSRLVTFEFGREHEDRTAPVPAGELEQTATRIAGQPVALTEVHSTGRFSDFSRLAHTYRAGRILLAGDAAHLHYPVGGQGLNLGLQDAFNLGWKLASVISGGVPDRLLDTYTDERRPYAERVIDYTREQAFVMDPDLALAGEQAVVLGQVATRGGRDRVALRISSQDVVTEAPGDRSAVTGRFVTDREIRTPQGATRLSALLAGGRGLLIQRTEGGPGSDAVAATLRPWTGRVEHVVDTAPAPGGGTATPPDRLLLIRPDGYAAWAGDDACELGPRGLTAALRRWFGAPEAPSLGGRRDAYFTVTVRRSTTPSP
jgi:2-polyprenyl-6-methoxyphenol hydroxylase-like FAD-dependent oxidoreductase